MVPILPAIAQDSPTEQRRDEKELSEPAEGEPSGEEAEPAGFRAGLGTGIVYEDPDLPLRLRPRALLAVDYRHHDRRNVRDRDQARLDRALVGIEGDLLDWVSFRILADLRGTDVDYGLEEGWVALEPATWFRVTGGLLRIPIGIEASFSEETLPFVDYAFPNTLTTRHDVGVRIDGELGEGLLSWDLVYAGGVSFDAFGERRAGQQVSGRLVTYPFRWVDLAPQVGPYRFPLLSGLFFSAGGNYAFDFEGDLDVATSFRNKLFHTNRLDARKSWYFHLGYGIDLGPIRITHEFARGSLLDLQTPAGTREDLERQITAWAASLAIRITGEPYDSRPFHQVRRDESFPRSPIAGDDDGWGIGTLEVAVRYSNGDIDRDFVVLGFTDLNTSAQEFRTFDVAVNWYPIRSIRVGFQLTRVIADQFPAVFDSHGRDTSFLFRLQISY